MRTALSGVPINPVGCTLFRVPFSFPAIVVLCFLTSQGSQGCAGVPGHGITPLCRGARAGWGQGTLTISWACRKALYMSRILAAPQPTHLGFSSCGWEKAIPWSSVLYPGTWVPPALPALPFTAQSAYPAPIKNQKHSAMLIHTQHSHQLY